jgi:UDP-N-acetylglucosamine 4,6-dehydratase/5-epimerase
MKGCRVDFSKKSVLITGGTGSFGRSYVRKLLSTDVERIVVFSRDEMKQWDMARELKDPRLRFFIGDVRDRNRLKRSLSGIDFVVHSAAMKIVPMAEYNPIECINTNIHGAVNVIEASLDMGVKKVVALSTDKASSPINLYGATKLASDKLFCSANSYSSQAGPIFAVVRYGNVMGSRGSVLPFFASLDPKAEFPITDPRMTRFMIDMKDAMDLVDTAFDKMVGGEIFVKKIKSMNILDIAGAFSTDFSYKTTGIREGEKLHEQMISAEDARTTFSYDSYYKILPNMFEWHKCSRRIGNGIQVPEDFSYTSDKNSEWMSIEELRVWLRNNLNF